MQRNVGGLDRNVRIVIGTVLVLTGAAGYAGMLRLTFGPVPQTLAAVLTVVVGGILLVTAATQKCPCNQALGVDTYEG